MKWLKIYLFSETRIKCPSLFSYYSKYLLPNDFPITVPSEFLNVVTSDTVLQSSPSANFLSSCISYTHAGISDVIITCIEVVHNRPLTFRVQLC